MLKLAVACIVNMVLDCIPMRKMIIKDHTCIIRLVQLTDNEDPGLKLTSIIALKNLLYEAKVSTKLKVMETLTYPQLFKLIEDPDENIRALALNLLRNFIHRLSFAQWWSIYTIEQTSKRIIELVANALKSKNPNIVTQALYVFCNIFEVHPDILMRQDVREVILPLIDHKEQAIQTAVLWCMINSTWEDDEGYGQRVEMYKSIGLIPKLKCMLEQEHLELDVKDRVRQLLVQLKADGETSA